MFTSLKRALIHWLTNERPYEGIPLCDFERLRYEIRPCDVLLIEGRNRVSDVIKQVTQSPWTHACLYIGKLHDIDDKALREKILEYYQGNPDEQLIVEGYLGKGTIISTIQDYRNDHIRICRPRGLSRHDAQAVAKHAILRLGSDYDIRQIFDLWRFMLPWSLLPRRWRSSLFIHPNNQTTRTVCSTIIAQAFNSVHFPILPIMKQHEETGLSFIKNNAKLITPKDFDYSPYFDIIKYPFHEFSGRSFYKDLPWHKENEVESKVDADNIDKPPVDTNTLDPQARKNPLRFFTNIILQRTKHSSSKKNIG